MMDDEIKALVERLRDPKYMSLDLEREAADALERLAEEREPKPIETAPADTDILGLNYDGQLVVMFLDKHSGEWTGTDFSIYKPVSWWPLPARPEIDHG